MILLGGGQYCPHLIGLPVSCINEWHMSGPFEDETICPAVSLGVVAQLR